MVEEGQSELIVSHQERFVELFNNLAACLDADFHSAEDMLKSLYKWQNVKKVETDCYWYHPDHLGSSSWITDTAGAAVQHLHYLPWGEDFVNQRTTDFSARFTFSAKEKDSETGLSYFGSRYYSSDLSVWLSVDPMADKYPSLSPYVYCADNPVKLVDPNGDSIINKYALQLLKANNYVDALNERLSGLEKGTSEYRMTDKALSAAIDYRNIIKNKYEIVNNAISDFKEHCPKNYEKLNHLKDPNGFPVDIIVSLDFCLNKGENRGLSIINYRHETLPFSKIDIYFFNSVKMILNPRSCLDRDDIGRTFAHEGGHIYYEVTDPAGYKEWLDRNMISPVPGYDGHGEGDPSGNEAKKWEKAY